MRIIVLVAGARDQRVGIGERRDHREIGIAELALVVDDALALEARRLLGEEASLVDGEGNRWCRRRAPRVQSDWFRPDLVVFDAMSGRRMHETRAGVLGDMLAGEQRHVEVDSLPRSEVDVRCD